MKMFTHICLFFLLTACEVTHHHHGSYVTKDDTSKIRKGDTQQTVRELLGTPFIETKGNTWLYIGRSEDRMPFREPIFKDRMSYLVSFDSNNKVISTEKIELTESNIQFDTNSTSITQKTK